MQGKTSTCQGDLRIMPTNAGFVLPFEAMPAAQRSDSVFRSKQIHLSISWVTK
jgi:hypothetical protein